MMKKSIYTFCFLIMALLSLGGCGFSESAEEAELAVNEFHKLINAEDYDGLKAMIDQEGLEITPEKEWMKLFK